MSTDDKEPNDISPVNPYGGGPGTGLQVINQALDKTLNPNGFGIVNVSNATIAGVRCRVRF